MGNVTQYFRDSQTDSIYLSTGLQRQHGAFHKRLAVALEESIIPYSLLPMTQNIWARDYMPVQVSRENFVQFVYKPDYQQHFKEPIESFGWVSSWCNKTGMRTTQSDIVLDGGNVVRENRKAILTDKVFRENPRYSKTELLRKINDLLEVEKLIIIPQAPNDIIGHADGMVRFLDADTVLVNDYSLEEDKEFVSRFKLAIRQARLQMVALPYNPYDNHNDVDASGIYINYLRTRKALIVPIFKRREDDMAVKILQDAFPSTIILAVNSNPIAREGGLLNCISWTVMKPKDLERHSRLIE